MESRIKIVYVILSFLLPGALLNCDSSTSPDSQPTMPRVPFTELEVGQEWRFESWEKLYSGNRVFTGDTVSVTIIANKTGIVTFYEHLVNTDSISPSDTATFRFQIEDSLLKQIGTNRSMVFGFVANHDSVLILNDIDSNHVTVDMDTSLFLIREQTGKSRFIGHSDNVQIFSETYQNVIIYYDETPTYADGFGHLAILSLKEGIIATIYFGGFSPIEQYGYQLVRQ